MMSAVLLLAALLLAGGPQSESAALATSPEVYDRLVAWITSQGGDVVRAPAGWGIHLPASRRAAAAACDVRRCLPPPPPCIMRTGGT